MNLEIASFKCVSVVLTGGPTLHSDSRLLPSRDALSSFVDAVGYFVAAHNELLAGTPDAEFKGQREAAALYLFRRLEQLLANIELENRHDHTKTD